MSLPAHAISAALLSLASLTAAAEPVAVPDTFDMHDVSDPDAANAMARCIGGAPDSLHDFIATHGRPGDVTKAALDMRKGGIGSVVAGGPFWACVTFSPAGFPVWPAEALAGAVTVRGVDTAVQTEWARKVMAQVAQEGEGHGLIILNSGDGLQVNVIAEDHRALAIHYTTRKVPKEEIDRQRFAAVIDDPKFAGVTTTRMGTINDGALPSVFAIPAARMRKAVDGDYLHEQADDLTARFDFTGTRWRFGGKSLDAVVELQADGQAVEDSSGHKTTGTWRIEAGVLHLALGAARFSLVLSDGGDSLRGDARRKLFPGEKSLDPLRPDADDFRWTLTLKRA